MHKFSECGWGTGVTCLYVLVYLYYYILTISVFIADELIRQVTINCAERGLLLLRVRDEIRMTIAAYQTLYESSVAFGMRKALQAEQGKADMEKKVRKRESSCESKKEIWFLVPLNKFYIWYISVSGFHLKITILEKLLTIIFHSHH